MQLDNLAERRVDGKALNSRKDEARAAVIPPDVKARMDEIDDAYAKRIRDLDETITQLRNQIKKQCHGTWFRCGG